MTFPNTGARGFDDAPAVIVSSWRIAVAGVLALIAAGLLVGCGASHHPASLRISGEGGMARCYRVPIFGRLARTSIRARPSQSSFSN